MAIKLKNLHKWEKVDFIIRRHWIAFVFLTLYFLWAVILTSTIPLLFGVNTYTLFFLCLFWMLYSIFLYVSWLNYELDIFIFTNNRVICIEQISFLNRAVGETTLDKVQEVAIETKWLLANLFDFGTLTIVTAGSTPSFDMPFSPKPLKSSRYINNLVDRYRDALYKWVVGQEKFSAMAKTKAKADQKNQVATDPSIQVEKIIEGEN